MIKSINLKPYTTICNMPVYVKRGRISEYTLVAKIKSGYEITIGRLTLGTAKLDDVVSSHALFESYDERGVRMLATRGRVAGANCESVAAKIAMEKAGIKFDLDTPCHFLDLLNAIGARYHAINPDIEEYGIVSQTCH